MNLVIVVTIVLGALGLWAWARAHIEALGRPARVGSWLALAVAVLTGAGYFVGMWRAEGALTHVPVETRQEVLSAGVNLMVMSMLGGAVALGLVATYLVVVLKLRS